MVFFPTPTIQLPGGNNGKKTRQLTLVSFVSNNWKTGFWKTPESLEFVKHMLRGKTVAVDATSFPRVAEVLGTHIPHKRIIVVANQPHTPPKGCELALSEKAIYAAALNEEVFVLGKLCNNFFSHARKIVLIHVDTTDTNGAGSFPSLKSDEWIPRTLTNHSHVHGIRSYVIEYTRRPQPRH